MILVDDVQQWETKLRHKSWSHMVSTLDDDELHAFAARLGLKRAWHQNGSFSHYDITPPKRDRAIKLGALVVTSRELLFCNHDYAKRRPGKAIHPDYQLAAVLARYGVTLGK